MSKNFYDNTQKLYDAGYGKKIAETLVDFANASPAGNRHGGTPQEHATSEFLLKEFLSMNIDARLEAIPVDSFELKGAKVMIDGTPALDGKTIPARVFQASQIAGFKGTEGEITAKCIYVGKGLKENYNSISTDPDFFKDKIVLIDGCFDTIWVGWQSSEATIRGALAAIYTIDQETNTGSYLKYSPDALVGQDGENNIDDLPIAYICETHGKVLKEALKKNPDINITFDSKVNFTPADNGGIGYNVIAEIPGSQKDKVIMIGAHQDCHLKAGCDDTGAVATVMMMAKAMVMSGYKPEATIRFLLTSSEEYGKINTIYDWQHGATEAMAAHPEWSNETIAFMNYEVMPEKGGVPMFRGVPEITDIIRGCASKMKGNLYPSKINVESLLISIADDYVVTANGIPSVDITSMRAEDYSGRYHTTEDRIENIDYDAMRQIINASYDMILAFDAGLVDYNLTGRIEDFRAFYENKEVTTIENGFLMELSREEFKKIDINPVYENKLNSAYDKWSTAIVSYNDRKSKISDYTTANRKLIAYNKQVLSSLIASSVGQNTIYPHMQTLSDALALKLSIEELTKNSPSKEAVLAAFDKVNLDLLGWIPLTKYINWFSKQACNRMFNLYKPLEGTWGYYAKLSPLYNIYSEYEAVRDSENPNYTALLPSFKKMYSAACTELENRLEKMAEAISKAADILNTI